MAGNIDEEKGLPPQNVVYEASASGRDSNPVETSTVEKSDIPESDHGAFSRLNARLASLNLFEARGIERIPLEERHDVKAVDYMQMTLLWFSTNITANNMAVGMLGPLSYGLGFVDSALCATFGALLGAAGVAYMGTFGPASGNRTMVRCAASLDTSPNAN